MRTIICHIPKSQNVYFIPGWGSLCGPTEERRKGCWDGSRTFTPTFLPPGNSVHAVYSFDPLSFQSQLKWDHSIRSRLTLFSVLVLCQVHTTFSITALIARTLDLMGWKVQRTPRLSSSYRHCNLLLDTASHDH